MRAKKIKGYRQRHVRILNPTAPRSKQAHTQHIWTRRPISMKSYTHAHKHKCTQPTHGPTTNHPRLQKLKYTQISLLPPSPPNTHGYTRCCKMLSQVAGGVLLIPQYNQSPTLTRTQIHTTTRTPSHTHTLPPKYTRPHTMLQYVRSSC